MAEQNGNSNSISKSSEEKILYRVEKISNDLQTLTLEEHVTVCNMLQQMLQFRVAAFQKKSKAEEEQVKHEAERQAKFGLVPGRPS